MIEKYIYENIANTGFKWHPVTDEGEILFYPCGDLKGVKALRSPMAMQLKTNKQTKKTITVWLSTSVGMMEKPNKSSFQVGQKKVCQYFN